MFKKDIVVRCKDAAQLGKLLHWLRSEGGLSQLSRVKFPVTAVTGSALGEFADQVLCYDVQVPHYLYAKLRDRYLKEVVISEVNLQEQVFSSILS